MGNANANLSQKNTSSTENQDYPLFNLFLAPDNDFQKSPGKALQIELETSQTQMARAIKHTNNHSELFSYNMFEEMQLITIKSNK